LPLVAQKGGVSANTSLTIVTFVQIFYCMKTNTDKNFCTTITKKGKVFWVQFLWEVVNKLKRSFIFRSPWHSILYINLWNQSAIIERFWFLA
jgi:hypothetical protein